MANQDGLLAQAGGPDLPASAICAIGRCATAITLVTRDGTSAAYICGNRSLWRYNSLSTPADESAGEAGAALGSGTGMGGRRRRMCRTACSGVRAKGGGEAQA